MVLSWRNLVKSFRFLSFLLSTLLLMTSVLAVFLSDKWLDGSQCLPPVTETTNWAVPRNWLICLILKCKFLCLLTLGGLQKNEHWECSYQNIKHWERHLWFLGSYVEGFLDLKLFFLSPGLFVTEEILSWDWCFTFYILSPSLPVEAATLYKWIVV